MKILQVIPYYPPAYAFGGPAKVAYQICKELVKKGHDVTVYTSDAKDLTSRLRMECVNVVDGAKVYYFKNASMKLVNWSKLFVTRGLLSKARDEVKTFDIVHLHEYRTFQNVVIHHYARKSSVPYVLQAHGSLPRIVAKQRLKRFYDEFFGNRLLLDASKVIALTMMEAEQYRHAGVPDERIAVIPNGIDLSEYANLPSKGGFRNKFGIGDNERIVLYLGRINRIKGLDILVRAFADVVGKLDDVRLMIVGPDDGYLGKLEALIKALKIEDNVLISDPLYGRDKLEAYIDADVYVLPSRYETFPMSILEAVACRTPVILTRNCGMANHFRDNVGLVVNPDSSHLGESLLEMLLNQERHGIFRENCNALIKTFGISKTVSRLEEVYKEIAN